MMFPLNVLTRNLSLMIEALNVQTQTASLNIELDLAGFIN